jgi:hypothetical protein
VGKRDAVVVEAQKLVHHGLREGRRKREGGREGGRER